MAGLSPPNRRAVSESAYYPITLTLGRCPELGKLFNETIPKQVELVLRCAPELRSAGVILHGFEHQRGERGERAATPEELLALSSDYPEQKWGFLPSVAECDAN